MQLALNYDISNHHHFICHQVDRTIGIAGPEQMVEFKNLFEHTTRKNLSDEHLWLSVIARPPTSRFTHLQRVSCCLVLLFTTMLANAMFYERVPDDDSANVFQFGPFALSPQQVCIFVCLSGLKKRKARERETEKEREEMEREKRCM